MSTPMLGLRTTIYMVSDMAEAKAWYTEVFQARPYFDEPFYIGFNIAGYELGLHPEKNPAQNKPESVMTYWGVNNVQSEFDSMISLGATAHENPTNVGGEIVVASVKDPWDNIIGLIYNPEFQLP